MEFTQRDIWLAYNAMKNFDEFMDAVNAQFPPKGLKKKARKERKSEIKEFVDRWFEGKGTIKRCLISVIEYEGKTDKTTFQRRARGVKYYQRTIGMYLYLSKEELVGLTPEEIEDIFNSENRYY